MNGSRPVPQVQLTGRHLSAVWPMVWRCSECEMPFVAVSVAALNAAIDDHTAHVNAHAEKATDVHFASLRLDRLLVD